MLSTILTFLKQFSPFINIFLSLNLGLFATILIKHIFFADYIGFVKRALVLLKKYSLIKRVELLVEKTEDPPSNDNLPPISKYYHVCYDINKNST